MLDLKNPLMNSVIVYTVILFLVYITRPNMFVDENLNIIHQDISFFVFGIPIALYCFFNFIKKN
jgi:hypothetical protein